MFIIPHQFVLLLQKLSYTATPYSKFQLCFWVRSWYVYFNNLLQENEYYGNWCI